MIWKVGDESISILRKLEKKTRKKIEGKRMQTRLLMANQSRMAKKLRDIKVVGSKERQRFDL